MSDRSPADNPEARESRAQRLIKAVERLLKGDPEEDSPRSMRELTDREAASGRSGRPKLKFKKR